MRSFIYGPDHPSINNRGQRGVCQADVENHMGSGGCRDVWWMISGYLTRRSPARHNEPRVHSVKSAINSNTVSHTSCASPPPSPPHLSLSLTFVLWLCARDDPFNQAALHQSFPREPWLLPLPRILHSAWRGLNAVRIAQQAAIDHLAIRLEDGGGGERERESSGRCGNELNQDELFKLNGRLCASGKYDSPRVSRCFT